MYYIDFTRCPGLHEAQNWRPLPETTTVAPAPAMPEAQHGLKTALRIVWILVRGAFFGFVASEAGGYQSSDGEYTIVQ